MTENINDKVQIDNTDEQSCDMNRRDAMKKMGKYAVYTAPAMLTLLASKKSMAGISMLPM
jgi:hypothetical protein